MLRRLLCALLLGIAASLSLAFGGKFPLVFWLAARMLGRVEGGDGEGHIDAKAIVTCVAMSVGRAIGSILAALHRSGAHCFARAAMRTDGAKARIVDFFNVFVGGSFGG